MNNTLNTFISKNDLVVYIRELFRLEYKKVSLEEAQKNLTKEVKSIKDITYDYKPKLEHIQPPKVPSDKLDIKKYFRWGSLCAVILFVLFIVVGPTVISPFIPADAALEPYAYGLLIGAIICAIICILVIPRVLAKKANTKEKDEYDYKLTEYNLALEKAQKKYESDIKKWEESCKQIDEQNKNLAFTRNCKYALILEMGKAIQETEGALKTLYAYDVIYPQYRTYNAIANILSYFESGRVDTLKEALNKYDEDVFRGKVLTSLDEISFLQEMTYNAIENNNNLVQNAISGINTIASQNNTMLNYQQVAAENSQKILSSVKSVEFLQTIEMMDRLTSR